jgi:hypothetical protein
MHHTTKTDTTRGRRRVHDIEVAGRRFLSVLETTAERHVDALLKHLNFASRHEVHGLLLKVTQLEQRLTRSDQPVDCELGHSMNASAIPGPPAQTTSLRRYAELLWDEV